MKEKRFTTMLRDMEISDVLYFVTGDGFEFHVVRNFDEWNLLGGPFGMRFDSLARGTFGDVLFYLQGEISFMLYSSDLENLRLENDEEEGSE